MSCRSEVGLEEEVDGDGDVEMLGWEDDADWHCGCAVQAGCKRPCHLDMICRPSINGGTGERKGVGGWVGGRGLGDGCGGVEQL